MTLSKASPAQEDSESAPSSPPDDGAEVAKEVGALESVLNGRGGTEWLLDQLFQHDNLHDRHPERMQQKIDAEHARVLALENAVGDMRSRVSACHG